MTASNIITSARQQQSGEPIAHDSAVAQISGSATYVDDIPEVRGTLRLSSRTWHTASYWAWMPVPH